MGQLMAKMGKRPNAKQITRNSALVREYLKAILVILLKVIRISMVETVKTMFHSRQAFLNPPMIKKTMAPHLLKNQTRVHLALLAPIIKKEKKSST